MLVVRSIVSTGVADRKKSCCIGADPLLCYNFARTICLYVLESVNRPAETAVKRLDRYT